MIAQDRARVERFASAMSFGNSAPGHDTSFFVDGLPWGVAAGQCPDEIVDVGGSRGDLCQALLRRYPGIKKAVTLDLAEVVADAQVPGDLQGRLEFRAYDFLTERVALQADAFVFRHIFYDWGDKYAVRILQNLVPALRNGTKVWLSEPVLGQLDDRNHLKGPNAPVSSKCPKQHKALLTKMYRATDLMIKVTFNGKERNRADWNELFANVDPRLQIEGITKPKGATDSIIQVVFKD